MTILAPFDGSELSVVSVDRAGEFASVRDERLVVLTVVPDDEAFAVERGWIDPGEELDTESVCAEFESVVYDIEPTATFRCERAPRSESMTATTVDDITRTVRRVAEELDVSVVFIGSDSTGLVSIGDGSVGEPLSTDPRYDVHIVRHAE